MADTTFIDQTTVIPADWCNDVNRLHYTILGDPADLAATKTVLGSVSASETVEGLVERATDAEASTGTDTTRYVTPKQLADNTVTGAATTFAVKTADTVRTSTTTLAVDPHITLPVSANKIYIVELVVLLDSPSQTPDFKYKFDVPASAELFIDTLTTSGSSSSPILSRVIRETGTTVQTIVFINAPYTVSVRGMLLTSGTAGTLDFTWAQNVSDPADMRVRKGSWLRLTEVA